MFSKIHEGAHIFSRRRYASPNVQNKGAVFADSRKQRKHTHTYTYTYKYILKEKYIIYIYIYIERESIYIYIFFLLYICRFRLWVTAPYGWHWLLTSWERALIISTCVFARRGLLHIEQLRKRCEWVARCRAQGTGHVTKPGTTISQVLRNLFATSPPLLYLSKHIHMEIVHI